MAMSTVLETALCVLFEGRASIDVGSSRRRTFSEIDTFLHRRTQFELQRLFELVQFIVHGFNNPLSQQFRGRRDLLVSAT